LNAAPFVDENQSTNGIRERLMERRFSIWAILAFGAIAAASLFGWALTSAIGPRKPNYNPVLGVMPMRPMPVPVVVRNFTAFNPPRKPTIPEANEFMIVLDAIASSALNRNAETLQRCFVVSRMAEEEIPLGFYALFGTQPTRSIIDSAASEIQNDLATLATDHLDLFPSGAVEIRQVMWNNDRMEALVLARHSDPVAGVRFTRWWMARGPLGQWRVYDFDFPDSRLRFLTVRNYLLQAPVRDHVGAGPNRDPNPNAPDLVAYGRYQNAFEWMKLAGTAMDPAAANASIGMEPIEQVPMLPYVQAARQVLRARQHALRGDAEKTRLALEAIPANLATAAHVRFAKAVLANVQKKPAEAREAIREYRTYVGDDSIAYREDAKVIAVLAGPAEAIAELRKGLKVFPGDAGIAMDLARRLPADERAALGEELAKTAKPELLGTAVQLFERQFPTILDALCTGWLKASPDDPQALAYAILAKIAVGQSKAAAELLKRAPHDLRRSLVSDLVRRATFIPGTGHAELFEVLSSGGEGRRSFRPIAQAFAYSILQMSASDGERKKRADTLRSITVIHRAADAADPYLHYAEAILLAAAGEHEKADAELAAGLAMFPAPKNERRPISALMNFVEDEREPLRMLRTDLLAKRQHWKRAYETIAPKATTFDQLAYHLAAAKDDRALAELIELHAKAQPGDVELIVWRAEIAYLTKDYETAVRRLRDYRDKSGKENRHAIRIDERLIRSLVRLNRPEDAAAALEEASEAIRNGKLFPVLIAAARGDADAVLEHYDSINPFNPVIWYSDPDLGPLLRGPAFDRVRQKYPPPVR
jgi:hypothetical protein